IGILVGIAYSVPPLRLKRIPFVDTFINGIAYGVLLFIAGWVIFGGALSTHVLVLALPVALIIASGHYLLAIPDAEIDELHNQGQQPRYIWARRKPLQ
ncbi:MAG: UbiA family prenyltransferase, partial [Thermoplasmatales archaeon]|nr:UbiA family prenyltransferase [Thermoplasmatales archaeon]